MKAALSFFPFPILALLYPHSLPDFAMFSQFMNGMGGMGGAPGMAEEPEVPDTAEKVHISGLSLLKMLKHGFVFAFLCSHFGLHIHPLLLAFIGCACHLQVVPACPWK